MFTFSHQLCFASNTWNNQGVRYGRQKVGILCLVSGFCVRQKHRKHTPSFYTQSENYLWDPTAFEYQSCIIHSSLHGHCNNFRKAIICFVFSAYFYQLFPLVPLHFQSSTASGFSILLTAEIHIFFPFFLVILMTLSCSTAVDHQ